MFGEGGVHPCCSVLLQRWEDVAVGVQRQADLRVAERLHHDARIDALREQHRCARMPEIVKADVREVCSLRLELPRHVPGFVRQPAVSHWESASQPAQQSSFCPLGNSIRGRRATELSGRWRS